MTVSLFWKRSSQIVLLSFVSVILISPYSITATSVKKVEKLAAKCEKGQEKSCLELIEIAKNDEDWRIRYEAVAYINDPDALAEIARDKEKKNNSDIRKRAVRKITDETILAEIARTDRDDMVRWAAVQSISAQDALAEIATGDKNSSVREAALDKLQDQAVIYQIAGNDTDASVRRAALEKLTDPNQILEIAGNDPDMTVRLAAAIKTGDQDLLKKIALADEADIHVKLRALIGAADQTLQQIACRYSSDIRLASKGRYGRRKVTVYNLDREAPRIASGTGLENIRSGTVDMNFGEGFRPVTLRYDDGRIDKIVDDGNQLVVVERDVSTFISFKNRRSNRLVVLAALLIGDEQVRVHVAMKASSWIPGRAALSLVKDQALIMKVVREAESKEMRGIAVNYVSDQAMIRDLAKNSDCDYVRWNAAENITDQTTLVELATNSKDPVVRENAVENPNLTDQSILERIAGNDDDGDVRRAAIGKLTNVTLLEEIARTDTSKYTRITAKNRLEELQKK